MCLMCEALCENVTGLLILHLFSLYPNGHLHFVLFLLFPVFNQFKHNRKTESKVF